jgi:hypothetical protein
LFLREHAALWQVLRQSGANDGRDALSAEAHTLLEILRARGVSFLRELGLPGRDGLERREGQERRAERRAGWEEWPPVGSLRGIRL